LDWYGSQKKDSKKILEKRKKKEPSFENRRRERGQHKYLTTEGRKNAKDQAISPGKKRKRYPFQEREKK